MASSANAIHIENAHTSIQRFGQVLLQMECHGQYLCTRHANPISTIPLQHSHSQYYNYMGCYYYTDVAAPAKVLVNSADILRHLRGCFQLDHDVVNLDLDILNNIYH